MFCIIYKQIYAKLLNTLKVTVLIKSLHKFRSTILSLDEETEAAYSDWNPCSQALVLATSFLQFS